MMPIRCCSKCFKIYSLTGSPSSHQLYVASVASLLYTTSTVCHQLTICQHYSSSVVQQLVITLAFNLPHLPLVHMQVNKYLITAVPTNNPNTFIGSLTFSLVLDKCCLIFHHRINSKFLIVLGSNDGNSWFLAWCLDWHLFDNLYLCIIK